MLKTSILLLNYNRPHATASLIAALRPIAPQRVFFACDGAKPDRIDQLRVNLVRSQSSALDWGCEVTELFAPVNHGCRVGVESAIDAAFEQSDRLIILEDDCHPHPEFFLFCEAMLDRYEQEEAIAQINGHKFAPGGDRYSYHYSHYLHCWGWATWRDRWQSRERDPAAWLKGIEWAHDRESERQYWFNQATGVISGAVDTWDYQWQFSAWCKSQMAIAPHSNLICNVGFDITATHTQSPTQWSFNKVEPILPIKSPPRIQRDLESDRWEARNVYGISD